MRVRFGSYILSAALFSLPAVSPAATNSAKYARETEEFRADFNALLQQDAQVQKLGYRLAAANAPFCDNKQMAYGLFLQDAMAYDRADILRQILGLTSDIYVQLAVEGAPAAKASLPPFASITHINGAPILPPTRGEKPWERLQRINADIAKAGTLRLTLAGGETRELAGEAICAGRFEVVEGSPISANGERVRVGRKFDGFQYPEDEFAAVLAHEMAHNVLAHPAWLEAHGRRWGNVRQTEREADRMMPWLLFNAGYEPEAAARFMRRFGPKHDPGIFRTPTHDGWKTRLALIEAEIATLKSYAPLPGQANWNRDFVREVGGK